MARPSTMGTLAAYWRQGLQTLQDFFAHPFGDSRQVAPTPGTAGQPTPIEVYQQKHHIAPRQAVRMEQGRGPLDAYAEQLRAQAQARQQQQGRQQNRRPGRGMGMG